MLDPIAYAWAACNPRVPPPESLECRAVTATEVATKDPAQIERDRAYQREWRRRRRVALAI
jgi:hypothetical protein